MSPAAPPARPLSVLPLPELESLLPAPARGSAGTTVSSHRPSS